MKEETNTPASPWPMISIAEANRISLAHTAPLPAQPVRLAQSLVGLQPPPCTLAHDARAPPPPRPLAIGGADQLLPLRTCLAPTWHFMHRTSRRPRAHGLLNRILSRPCSVCVLCHNEQGRVLAEDVMAQEPIPAAPTSIMDGYAVVAADGVGEFDIVGGTTLAMSLDAPTAALFPAQHGSTPGCLLAGSRAGDGAIPVVSQGKVSVVLRRRGPLLLFAPARAHRWQPSAPPFPSCSLADRVLRCDAGQHGANCPRLTLAACRCATSPQAVAYPRAPTRWLWWRRPSACRTRASASSRPLNPAKTSASRRRTWRWGTRCCLRATLWVPPSWVCWPPSALWSLWLDPRFEHPTPLSLRPQL
jgi:hypothetical protein